jgi:hypothetical protein
VTFLLNEIPHCGFPFSRKGEGATTSWFASTPGTFPNIEMSRVCIAFQVHSTGPGLKVRLNPGGRLSPTLVVGRVPIHTSSQLRHHWSPGGRLRVDRKIRVIARHNRQYIELEYFFLQQLFLILYLISTAFTPDLFIFEFITFFQTLKSIFKRKNSKNVSNFQTVESIVFKPSPFDSAYFFQFESMVYLQFLSI